jgi:hypothetical protein
MSAISSSCHISGLCLSLLNCDWKILGCLPLGTTSLDFVVGRQHSLLVDMTFDKLQFTFLNSQHLVDEQGFEYMVFQSENPVRNIICNPRVPWPTFMVILIALAAMAIITKQLFALLRVKLGLDLGLGATLDWNHAWALAQTGADPAHH